MACLTVCMPYQVAAIILAKNIDGELAAEIEGDDACMKEAADGSQLGESMEPLTTTLVPPSTVAALNHPTDHPAICGRGKASKGSVEANAGVFEYTQRWRWPRRGRGG